MSVYDFTCTTMQGKEVSLSQYKGKVILIVNTASKCGFTPQFAGLEKLYKEYKDKGLEILGFPSNQFNEQDPGTNEEIQEFCKVNYGVTFQMFKKGDVRGDNPQPLFAYLTKEKGFKGFSIGKVEHKLGIRASSTTELVFEDCIVPKENLLGDLNKGFKIAMTTLDGGRVGVAAQALGIAEGAFNETIKYMKERIQFGKPLSAFQGLQWMVADMKCEIESSKLLLYRAAMAKDSGKPFSMDAAMAKLRCAETAMDVTTKCVQLHGGYGYSREYPIERMMRDAKITEIYEGTSQVQKMVISGAIFR